MVFKLLFLLSLVLGSVFLDAFGLVEYEDEISSLDKLEWGFAELIFFYQSCLSQQISETENYVQLWSSWIIQPCCYNEQRSAYDLW